MKRTLFRITMLILLGLTFFAIFNFSSQDGQTSSGLSRKVARKIVDIFPYTKNLSEIHQGFTPGRTPSPIDVGIDTCGVMFGIVLVLIAISVYKALTEKKNHEL